MEMEIERSDFVGAVSRLGDSVYSFHERFGLPTVAHEGEDVILEALRRRLALLSEEVGEHARELNKGNVRDAVSEAVDIAYVALGTVLVLGNEAATPATRFRTRTTPRPSRRTATGAPPARSSPGSGRSMMDGEVCIVTGAGSGIGRATALKLAEAGAVPVLVGRTTSKLRDVAAEIAAAGGASDVEQADVTDYDAMRALAASVLDKHGRIDVIVNNAGFTSRRRYLLDTTDREAEDVVRVNLLGPFFLIQAALPSMLERRSGTIVNVSSRAGVDPVLLGGAMYSASKAAIINLTKYINVELKNTGIRACNIIPGETDTPVLKTRLIPPGPDQLAKILQPEDVADAILFAVSSPSRVLIDEVIVKPRFQRDVSAEVPDPIPADLKQPPV